MKKKAILGGTFDPIHNGHLSIAYQALYSLNLDSILFMPTGNPPHKAQRHVTDGWIRYELIKMAIREEPAFQVSDFELNENGLSFTYKTLEYFSQLERNTQWYFITGTDCLMELDSWKNVERIMKAAQLVVFKRPGYSENEILCQKKEVEKKYKEKILFLDIPLLEISSSYIKENIRKKRNVDYLVPKGVYHAIQELNLYNTEAKKCGQKEP